MMKDNFVQSDEAVALNNLFKEKFNMDFELCNKEKCSRNLLCSDMGLKPRDLLILYYEIEARFRIEIPEEAIVEGRFCSFESILDTICRCRYAEKTG